MNDPIAKPHGVPDEVPIPDDDFNEFLEWTPDEEEAFLQIIKDNLDN